MPFDARPYAYASTIDVLGHLSFASGFSATSRPNATQVHGHLLAVSDEIDSMLAQADYSIPIATGATQAMGVLRYWTGLGAAMHVAYAMPQGKETLHGEFLERRFTAILGGIHAGDITLPGDAAQDTTLSLPRFGSVATGATPYFSRAEVGDV